MTGLAAIKVAGVVTLCVLLAGCVTDGAALPNVACGVFKPLSYSRLHDTHLTIRGIVGHNAAGRALCGWKPVAR